MTKPTDVRPIGAVVYFLPITTRMPLKFGPEIATEATCARIRVTAADRRNRRADGWGETPLSVQWVWPSRLGYDERHQALLKLTSRIAKAWITAPPEPGRPIELGDRFVEDLLPDLLDECNDSERQGDRAGSLAGGTRPRFGVRPGRARRLRRAPRGADLRDL